MSNDIVNLPTALRDYYSRVGAEVLNFKRAIIKIHKGQYYTERCLIKVNSDGTLDCNQEEFEPTEAEVQAIKSQWVSYNHPTHVEAEEAMARDRISWLKHQRPDSETHMFYSRLTGRVIMLQQRYYDQEGARQFIPHTLWSDGNWRTMEPEDKLPLWKPRKARKARVMVHEGSKAAMAAEAIATDPQSTHPWKEFLAKYEHWGMIGGALAPHRTDWKELQRERPEMVIYFCDNDLPGKDALQLVSRYYRRTMMGVNLDGRWPTGWDIADPMPAKFFQEDGFYGGPELEEMLNPATWATEKVQTGQVGRPTYEVTSDFAKEWNHCVTPEVYAHVNRPNEILSRDAFNNLTAPFSDVVDTASKLIRRNASKGVNLTYNPSIQSGIYNGDQGQGLMLNTYVPGLIKAREGDVSPFLEFMDHLFPIYSDRKAMLRWVATLVARPDIKMHYSVLLISETQGVGKGTLGEKILIPLVGKHNSSSPSETDLVDSPYNYWAPHKRLVVVHEIYAGHSAKAYDSLKSPITENVITVNQKYKDSYKIESWVHVFACSNSLNALKLNNEDRRWFVPKVAEKKLDRSYWSKFNDWLENKGGLSIIKHWCEEQIKNPEMVVLKGEPAPMSKTKEDVIIEGYTDAMTLVYNVLTVLKEEAEKEGRTVIVLDTDLVRMARELVYRDRSKNWLEKPRTMRKVAESAGYFVSDDRLTDREWGGPYAYRARVLIAGESARHLANGNAAAIFAAGRPTDVVSFATERKLVTF